MPESTTMPVRFCLDDLLEEKGMNQSELAKRSKVSLVTINAIANDRTNQVRLDTLDKIAKALNVEPGALLTREPKRKKGK